MILVLMLNFVALAKSDTFKGTDTREEDSGSRILRYAAYVPTLATTFHTHFPVFFVEDRAEIPSKQFGFNVIYGVPNNFDGVYPLSTDFKNNLNNKFYAHTVPLNKGSFSPKQNYANDSPFESTESVDSRHEMRNPSNTDEDWSAEEDKSHYGKQLSPPSSANTHKKFYNSDKPSPVSYVNNYRPFSRNPSTGNLKKPSPYRIYSSHNGKPSSSQQFHKSGLKSSRTMGKLYHREAFNSNPQKRLYSKSTREPFRPSPPDVFRNSQHTHSDFSTEYSNSVPNYSKLGNFTERMNVYTCVRNNKTEAHAKFPKKNRFCYSCVDNTTGSRYEHCTFEEAPLKQNLEHYQELTAPKIISNKNFRRKRETNSALNRQQPRDKRQNEYYDTTSSNQPYESYNQNYRFGPEHFVDDERTTEYEESSYETDDPDEKCWKGRKGEMLCIACENVNTGGTYEQCSYASDPNNSSYEQSGSREYGSPRFAEEGARKQYPDSISNQPVPLATSPPPKLYQEVHPPLGQADRLPYNYHALQSSGYNKPYSSPPPPPQYIPPYSAPPLPIPPVYTVPANTYFHNEPGFNDNFGGYRFSGFNNYRNPYSNFDDSFSNLFPEISSNPEPLSEFDDENEDDGDFSVSLDDEEGQFTMSNKHKIPRNTDLGHLDKVSRKDGLKRPYYEMSRKGNKDCKKVIKQKMTCYQCIDEKGAKREDCLSFRSKPLKNKKMSYRNYSEFNSTPSNDHILITKKITNRPEVRLVSSAGRYNPPHVINSSRSKYPYHSVVKPEVFKDRIEGVRYTRSSDNKETVANVNTSSTSAEKSDQSAKETSVEKNDSSVEHEKEIKEDLQTTKKYNSVPPEPAELKETEPNTEGKFSKDTELLFDPVLGISLPKYMLEKSEHEAIFDEILASG